MKKIFIIILLIFMTLFAGCGPTTTINDVVNNVVNNSVPIQNNVSNIQTNNKVANINTLPNSNSNSNSLKIASWNIQNFGQSKANDGRIIKIADILDNYGIVAIQEISNINELVDNKCSRNVNAMSSPNFMLIEKQLLKYLKPNYKIKISPEIKDERYGFAYDSSKVKLESCWVSPDTNSGQLCEKSTTGLMSRESYNCKFLYNGKEFIYQTAHTSPSINMKELQGLEVFYNLNKEKTNNLILGGDFNYDGTYLKYDIFKNYNEIRFDDTTVASSVNDYDIFLNDLNDFRLINKGVYKNITKDISDHYLVWIEVQ